VHRELKAAGPAAEMFDHEDREKEEEEPELLEEAVDMGFDELLELLREEPPQLSSPLLLQSKRLFSLGQKSHQQQEQELIPHATAVSEAIHQESLPATPSLISTVQQQSWAPDLDGSGEGEISVPSSKLWVGGGLQCSARHIFGVIV
jgi:hypothetical protein